MKYIVMLGDGMADYPIEALGGKTPLMVAKSLILTGWPDAGNWGW